MQLIAHCVVEEVGQITGNEINRRRARNLLVVGLPQRGITRTASLSAQFSQFLGNANLTKIRQSESALIRQDRPAARRIDYAAAMVSGTWYLVCVAPEVSQLGPVASHDEQGRPAAEGLPSRTCRREVMG